MSNWVSSHVYAHSRANSVNMVENIQDKSRGYFAKLWLAIEFAEVKQTRNLVEDKLISHLLNEGVGDYDIKIVWYSGIEKFMKRK